ncbi:MAG: stalk domain-containing protein, partial [Caldisericum sp.]|uniref:stalk domain-containing protein n=2 Tax=Caldisericum sp. TaxID=2499687 RepID=UPI003D136A6A
MKRMARGMATILLLIVFILEAGGLMQNQVKAFTPTLHGNPVDVYFNDFLITDWEDALPYIDLQSGRTMIPLRFYSEKIGCEVSWEQKTKKITINYPGDKDYDGNLIPGTNKIITLWVGNRKTYVYYSADNT